MRRFRKKDHPPRPTRGRRAAATPGSRETPDREALGDAGEPGARPPGRQPGRQFTQRAARTGQRPAEDGRRRPEADGHQPGDRHHLLGARPHRDGRGPDRPGPSHVRRRQLAAAVGARRPGGRGRHPAAPLRAPKAALQGHRRRGVPGHPRRRRAADDPYQPARPAPGAQRGRLRRGHRRGPADPDRRPRPLRGRPRDPGRRRQLPDRGQDDDDPRSGGGDERRDPGPLVHGARARPDRHGRPGRYPAGAGQEPGRLPPRGHRARQPPHRRPVPQLPAGPAKRVHRPRGGRSRGPAEGRAPVGAHRQQLGQHRQAAGGRGLDRA